MLIMMHCGIYASAWSIKYKIKQECKSLHEYNTHQLVINTRIIPSHSINKIAFSSFIFVTLMMLGVVMKR